MADTKTTALSENTSPALSDILYIVDDPGGAPASEKATVENVLSAGLSYGDMYTTGGSAAQALTAATPAKLTLWTADGPSSKTTPDNANDQITIDLDGVYHINGQFAFTTSANNITMEYVLALGGVSQSIATQRKIGTGSDVGSCSFVGHLSLSNTDVLSVNIESSGNTNLTILEAQLTVNRVG